MPQGRRTDAWWQLGRDPWMAEGVCVTESVPPSVFFPDGADEDAVTLALSYCRRCPMEVTCREWARERRIEYGVWGGETEEERRSAGRPPVPRRRCSQCLVEFQPVTTTQVLCGSRECRNAAYPTVYHSTRRH